MRACVPGCVRACVCVCVCVCACVRACVCARAHTHFFFRSFFFSDDAAIEEQHTYIHTIYSHIILTFVHLIWSIFFSYFFFLFFFSGDAAIDAPE